MNLVGQKFGKLTVIELAVPKPYRKKSYLCKCDCGNTCIRLESTLKASLRDGRISSCGCYIKRYLQPGDSAICSKAGKCRKNTFVDECNVQMTFREGTIKTNTSGYQGVAWSNTAHKWHCYIGYKNYRLKQESAELLEKQQALEAKVESEEQRAKDLEELEKYMQTKKYAEEVARGKLGLVYPDEVLIEPER